MNHANTDKLFADFPRLYRDRQGPNSLMRWGFACRDGWFLLIYELSAAIEQEAARSQMDPESVAWPVVSQVKQKFGGLRFHLRNTTPRMRELITEAEGRSLHICEQCGAPGELHTDGWWATLCASCTDAFPRDGSLVD